MSTGTIAVYCHGTPRGVIECQVSEAVAAGMEISRGEWERWQQVAPEWVAKLEVLAESSRRKARKSVKTVTCARAGIDPDQSTAKVFRAESVEPVQTPPKDSCSRAAYGFWRATVEGLSHRKRGEPGYGSAPGPKWRSNW